MAVPGADDDRARAATLPAPIDPTRTSSDLTAEPSAARDERPPARSRTLGRYVLLDELGAGGMGVVYRARDPALDRALAIKIVRPAVGGSEAQARLLREARAMARLRHPAVVPVFDVGETAEGVFIAMPLLGGGTLHDWLHARRRPWRAVCDRFLAAGRGLAAAHAAGLVHRDFKPRNVLLDDAGAVQVADFGIATEVGTATDGAAATAGSRAPSSIAGTPAYMAPEQAAGGTIDARADQFSFCVAFWEGLHGERPQAAATRTHDGHGAPGVPPVPPERQGAPTWLRAAIARGFSPVPTQRWPSMAALLDHLERRLRRPRRIGAGLGAVALVGAGVVGALLANSPSAPGCADPLPRVNRVWGAAVRARATEAFAALGAPFAVDAVARATPVLDRYAADWRQAHIEACKDTRVRRTQSSELLDRRMVCLDRRLRALAALTHAMSETPTVDVAANMVTEAMNLPDLVECADAERLLAADPLPRDPGQRARVHAVERDLQSLEQRRVRGEVRTAADGSAAVLAAARATGHRPLVALTLRSVAQLQHGAGLESEPALRELIRVAAEIGDDHTVARAWIALLTHAGDRSLLAEARALEPVAEAAVLRAGAPRELTRDLQMASGTLAARADEHDRAVAIFGAVLEDARTSIERAEAHRRLAIILMARDGATAARADAEAALAGYRDVFGAAHPETASALELLATIELRAGNQAQAAALARQALAIQEAAYGADSDHLGTSLLTLSNIAMNVGRFDEARELATRLVAIAERGGPSELLANAHGQLARAIAKLEGGAAARPHYERGLEALVSSAGRDSLAYAEAEGNFAAALVRSQDCAAARPYLEHASATFERHGNVGQALILVLVAQCAVREARYADSIAALETALGVCAARECPASLAQTIPVQLGTYLVDTGHDRVRGLALVRAGRAKLVAAGLTRQLADLDAWLEEKDPAGGKRRSRPR